MKRHGIAAVVLAGGSLLLAGCSSTPSQSEAEQAVCDRLVEVRAAAQQVKDLSPSSTVEDAKAARESLDEALENLQSSAQDVQAADTAAVASAVGTINDAIDDVAGSDTLAGAAASVKVATAELDTAVNEMTDGLQCSTS